MKLKRTLILIAFVFTISSFKQKLTYKRNTMYNNGQIYFKTEWDKILRIHEIKNVRDSAFLIFKNESYRDPLKASEANKTGTVNYIEAKIPGKDSVLFELNPKINLSTKMKILAKLLIKFEVISSNGYVDSKKLNSMGNTIGKPFSRRRREIRY